MDDLIRGALTAANIDGFPPDRHGDLVINQITSYRAMKTWVMGRTEAYGMVYAQHLGPAQLGVPTLTIPHGGADLVCLVTTLARSAADNPQVQLTAGGNELRTVILFFGSLEICGWVAAIPRPQGVQSLRYPTHSLQPTVQPADYRCGQDYVKEDLVLCLDGSDEDLTAMLALPNISNQIKLLSVLLYNASYLTDWLRQNTTPLPAATFYAALGIQVPGPLAGTVDVRDLAFRRLSIIYLLGPAYSRGDKVIHQLFTRGTAAANSADLGFGGLEEFQTFMQAHPFTPTERTGIMDDALGHYVARDHHGMYHIEATVNTLGTIEELREMGSFSIWGSALLIQARLVYEGKHSTTLGFAIQAYPSVASFFTTLGARWEDERLRMEHLIAVFSNRPYTGLRRTLADTRHIKQFARMAYIGCLLKKKNLETEDEKIQFEHYATESIAQAIDVSTDKGVCKQIVNGIPKNEVEASATLIRGMRVAQARDIMDQEDEEFRNQVLKYLVSRAIECEWRTYYYGVRVKEEKARIYTLAKPLMVGLITEKFAALEAAIDAEEDRVERARLRSNMTNLRMHLMALVEGARPIESKVPDPPNWELADAYQLEVNRLEGLVAILQRMDLDYVGSGDLPEEPAPAQPEAFADDDDEDWG